MNGSKSDKNGSKQAKPQTVLAGAPDKPLVINGIEIQVYVLGNETRVISERGFNESLGTSSGGKANSELESARMPRIAQAKWLRPFISEKLKAVLSSPIEFTPPHGGRTAYGYPAESFVDICEAILKARDKDAISPQQDSIVLQADLILRGLARVGITALIDEATGYQKIREERALAIILERYISEELQPWVKTFPIEFYREICRLNNWPKEYEINRPGVVGKYTNNFVYSRLAPGLLEALREKNPALPNGNRLNKHHQWLNRHLGHPELQKRLEGIIALMKAAESWEEFEHSMERVYPKPSPQLTLPYPFS
ncbi:MAG: P63C domain-containing protein [Chloroflexota bacterium]|nr:P63C domain-containing protein [Chloroflexota bacterium]